MTNSVMHRKNNHHHDCLQRQQWRRRNHHLQPRRNFSSQLHHHSNRRQILTCPWKPKIGYLIGCYIRCKPWGLPSSDLQLQSPPYLNQNGRSMNDHNDLKHQTPGQTGKTLGVTTGETGTGTLEVGTPKSGIFHPGRKNTLKTETDRTCHTWTSLPSMGTRRTLRHTGTP